ncbi:DarT ssDNA thymidine ADP-ribosyltransferase family protein [uncultured Enorma sp.]|uniref:DarT ssDNA thymidine ADP-ribosyltransferase family protein n=1 Tax=uncultured Enorma sp. TaxID=1714346 RepID=UPI00265D77D5|nr:DarT ssDNA thymidine ADP-ribosyltransferase family protein [uncultured Enorma sp.]
MDEVRVSALAKEFGMSSKEMLAVLDDLKIPARSASSPLDGAFVRIVREKLPVLYPEKAAIQAEAKRRREEERQEDLQRREQARQHEERLLEERCAREREWRKARELVRAAEHAVRDVNRERRRKESFESRYASLLAQIEAQEATAKCKSPDEPEKGRWDDLCDKFDVGLIDELLRQLRRKGYLPEEASVESVRDVVLSSFEGSGLIERVPCEESWEHSPDIRSSYYWRVTDAGLESGIVQGTAKVSAQNFRFSALFPIFLGRGASLVFDELDRKGVLLEDPEAELEKRELAERRERAEAERRERQEAERREAERLEAERREAEREEIKRQTALRRRAEIEKIIQDRGIKKLYHFTQAKNLNSIFERGILSRNTIYNLRIDAAVNDNERWDRHTDAISVSISGPNYQMLYALKKGKQNRGETCPGDTFVLLELDPSLLYELDCAFYPTNAASNRVRHASKTEFQGAQALENMFADGVPCPAGTYSRAKWNLDSCETSDPQAEVLVFETIPARYIKCVLFETEEMDYEYSRWVTNRSHIPFKILLYDDIPFKPRRDFSDWKKGEKDGGDKQNGEGATDENGMAAYDDDEMW